MIKREDLKSIDYNLDTNSGLYVRWGSWEYGFDLVSQELFYLNDGVGEREFLVKITDFEKLKDLLELYDEI